jgi:hypothetical protein
VMQLISSLDLGRLIAMIGGLEGAKGGANKRKDATRSSLVDEEWLQRAESQCISEAIRCTTDDMRCLVAHSA